MPKLTFSTIEEAHNFAAEAENMSETNRDDGDDFVADQYAVLAQKIWDDLRLDESKYSVEVTRVQYQFADEVRDNLNDCLRQSNP